MKATESDRIFVTLIFFRTQIGSGSLSELLKSRDTNSPITDVAICSYISGEDVHQVIPSMSTRTTSPVGVDKHSYMQLTVPLMSYFLL